MKKGFCVSLLMLAAVAAQDCWAIEGGFNVSGDRWAHAVRIESTGGSCSATVITPKYAITAAHCVEPGDWSARVLRGDASEVNIGTATLAFIDPRYKSKGGSYDVAVLSLSLTPGDASTKNKIALQSSLTYLEMLNAKSPYRTVLVVGHGRDERDRLGKRKAATVGNLTPHVGEGEMLWAAYRPLAGATRPGDSGGGIYMLRESRMELTAVTSGSNTLTYKIEGDSYDSTIERYAPIAPSLCKASSEIRSALAFDATECTGIEATRKQLSTSFDEASLPLLLHMMRLLDRSPQLAIIGNDHLISELAVRAFVLGSRSAFVVKLVMGYLDRYDMAGEEKNRWKNNYNALENTLVEKHGMARRAYGRNYSSDVKKFIEEAQSEWAKETREEWRKKKGSSPCPYDNCLWQNEFQWRLSISASEGDWMKLFPAPVGARQFNSPSGLIEVSHLVCRLAEYVALRKDHLVDELLSGGISQANISSFDSGIARNITVKQGQVSFDAGVGDGGMQIEINNVELSGADKNKLSSALTGIGFVLERDDYGFFARKGDADDHTVLLSENYLQIFHISTTDFVSVPEFGVWRCGTAMD